MHLLQARAGVVSDGSAAVDTGQTPGDLVVLSAADTELALLARARARCAEPFIPVRLANLMRLAHNMSVDLYVDNVAAHARLIIVRLLGGVGYWPHGVARLARLCRDEGIALALLPGDDAPDPELADLSTVEPASAHRLWQYCVHGGVDNAEQFLRFAASLLGAPGDWAGPRPLLRAGLYWPGRAAPDISALREAWTPGRPVAAVVFYRALMQAGALAGVDALIAALQARGFNPLPVFTSSLKDQVAAATVRTLLTRAQTRIVLNATGFSVSAPGQARAQTPFSGLACPVLQVVFSGGSEAEWRAGTRGLSARDIAMNVALPEVDGRLLTRAVSFKSEARFDEATQCPVVTHEPVPCRVAFTADLAAAWERLRRTPAPERRIALVLANYPNRDGRLGNGVGLDTPASVITVLRAMERAGYGVSGIPANGNDLVALLAAGPTNAAVAGRAVRAVLPLAAYREAFSRLHADVRACVQERWGTPRDDPFFLAERDAFAVPVAQLGRVIVGVQPARGYNIDPAASYHDPALPPPHGYFAFYAWLRERVHAVVHVGKHGNLEWLPGKALALSAACFPEAALGPMPHIYPFIVNDPGEGSQAKRRAQAVIVDHLTPPLTRAESYGPLADLERMVDEYYEAAGLDPRRLKVLAPEILNLARRIGLDRDCGVTGGDGEDDALVKLDAYLCELKEMQIRDGLHIFGAAPQGRALTDLLVALTRVPRGDGAGERQSLIRALASDLGMDGFDPLDCGLGAPWRGVRPQALAAAPGAWRTCGDTVERLEALASELVAGRRAPAPDWSAARAVLDFVERTLRPRVLACGREEMAGLLTGLDGCFVPPGPSGAPTRGRPDVLPTGRNFYSVDVRAVPTPAAWRLGWASADLLVTRHMQDHGDWPRAMALSAWGTANMRTGGDDIAQALALMGARPTWDALSHRVTGFEILPATVLGRPRVDVTLRVSGFFRDAFPAQIDLFDSAVRAVAALDEPDEHNPLASRVRADARALVERGAEAEEAARRAGYRVFGAQPGAYGAGLQALMDERGWEDTDDLARAYVAWGGHAYGAGAHGTPEHGLFRARLSGVQAVIQNQDNREHDLLDSDDYYQFEGGMAAAVRMLSGRRPALYHNDHSRPERPVVRSLEEEIARVVRARVVNPKWIAGVMRHGYKGAFEMAATVDYLFAFAATAQVVADHHFDAVYDAYLEDPAVLAFLRENNPAALAEMSARMREALERGLWRPASNSAAGRLAALARGEDA